MVELYSATFADLVDQLHLEYERQGSIFHLPKRKWHIPDPAGPDLSVRFHGQPAATPVGPAAGPHTQMAQNLVLAWLAGARIFELKTVQINDRLDVPRPCIDAANVCYNVEWSQELRLADSLREYAAGTMLIHMLRTGDILDGIDLAGPLGETLYDISVGYDLAGIRSRPIRAFLEAMMDAGETIDALRLQIPARHRRLRDLDYPTRLSGSVTLSTFHGCPADEIERICEFLITEFDLDVIVKMNPPMLGKDRLEHLLHDVLGYSEIAVNPSAYSAGLQFDQAVEMSARLTALARQHNRRFGAKFSNTLEVINHRDVFTPDNKVMYLSGQPLHVITLTLADLFRQAVGPEMPISFSAGVDRHNFADMVACGFCPVTTCTDLLRPGGYARLPNYLKDLTARMNKLDSKTVADYILDVHRQRDAAGNVSAVDNVPAAAAANLTVIAGQTRNADRYRADRNRSVPKRIDSHLTLFDCISCDKCIPVCPNAANFVYQIEPQRVEFNDWIVEADGQLCAGPPQTLVIERPHQIANFADFCNECGNCDTFCPEYGGPFIAKPSFFRSLDAWKAHADHDGFHIETSPSRRTIHGRLNDKAFVLQHETATGNYVFNDGNTKATFPAIDRPPDIEPPAPEGHTIDMHAFHTLRLLLHAVLQPDRIHPANAAALAENAR